MKFNLLAQKNLLKNKNASHLFIIQTPVSTNSLKTLQLFELEPLLQKHLEKPNNFISSFFQNQPYAFLTVDTHQNNFLDNLKNFKKGFAWLQNQKTSEIYLHFSGIEDTLLTDLIPFIIKEYTTFTYEFNQLKTLNIKEESKQTIFFLVEHPEKYYQIVEDTLIIVRNIKEAKDLANLPGNICSPRYLATYAEQKAKELGVKCTIFNETQIKEIGMESFLSVAKGSIESPYFIQLEYDGQKDKRSQPIVLIGKGITFDSGGISLKPAATMDEMKYDMCGAANVLLTFFTAVELKLPLHLITLIPTCENMPSGKANKPGDIVKSLKGLSIEILNTDAEGRLILCDALTYAEKFKPQAVIDVATLTGACVIALGNLTSGILGNQQQLIDDLLFCSQKARDKAWQLPLWQEYDKALKSNFADLANVGDRSAGTITAACFLSHFIDAQYPWAHIDIAGTAWKSGKEKGATGRPIPLLIEFLKQKSQCF